MMMKETKMTMYSSINSQQMLKSSIVHLKCLQFSKMYIKTTTTTTKLE